MTDLRDRLAKLSVAHLSDGCLRTAVPMRVVAGVSPVLPGQRAQGRAIPVRHYGSVDVFLEAMENAGQGDVLVVANQDRADEGCIGDLTALEAAGAGLSGIIIWGRHRDTAIVRTLPIALFSRGACARGPVRLDPREKQSFVSAKIGDELVTAADWVVADDDGVIFLNDAYVERVTDAAEAIRDVEVRQAQMMSAGSSLREQLGFAAYLDARARDPAVDFRSFLRSLNAAIEE